MNGELILVTHYFSTHRGGVEKVAGELVGRLAKDHGWRATWVSSAGDVLPGGLGERVRLVPVGAWNGMERRFGIPWPIWHPRGLIRLWQAIGRADVLHLHDALYFGNLCACAMARLRGVPVIVTQHVGDVPYASALFRRAHASANRTLGRLVLGMAQQVVFVSPAVRDEFSRYCRFRSSPAYVPNGVDTSCFSPSGTLPECLEIHRAHQSGRRVFLFVGRFVEKKGLAILHDLALRLPHDLWVFAGHGPLDPQSWNQPNVLVVRGESGAGLARYYRAADVLVLPSTGEGFPLVVQEAMACGTPAMVGEETAAGCPEARALLLVEKLGDAMAPMRWAGRLSEQPGRRDGSPRRRSEVAAFARERWSWECATGQYAKLIGKLVTGHEGERAPAPGNRMRGEE